MEDLERKSYVFIKIIKIFNQTHLTNLESLCSVLDFFYNKNVWGHGGLLLELVLCLELSINAATAQVFYVAESNSLQRIHQQE